MSESRSLQNILVTGGAGFIGSNFIRYLLTEPFFRGRIFNLDKLTYAGNLESLEDVDRRFGGDRYRFLKEDVCDREALEKVFSEHAVDTVVHLAAESHVDRSIVGPLEFVRTNVEGTVSVLEAARKSWSGRRDVLFHHVSTDEVFGSLGPTGRFDEGSAYDPRSPYAASKAASDHFVRAYAHTHDLPVTISNCSNNYGPCQFPEKMIPFMIMRLLAGETLPVYGDGTNVRDWIHVRDHASALWRILREGGCGETYTVGGDTELRNIDLVNKLCRLFAQRQGRPEDAFRRLITFVKDRPGHDQRYAIDCGKIRARLGWAPEIPFEEGLAETVDWYLGHSEWVAHVQSGEYRSWIERNYGAR